MCECQNKAKTINQLVEISRNYFRHNILKKAYLKITICRTTNQRMSQVEVR